MISAIWQAEFDQYGQEECIAYVARLCNTPMPMELADGSIGLHTAVPFMVLDLLWRLDHEWTVLAHSTEPYCSVYAFNNKVGHQVFWLGGQLKEKNVLGYHMPDWGTFRFQEIVMLLDYWFSWSAAIETKSTIVTLNKNRNILFHNENKRKDTNYVRYEAFNGGMPKFRAVTSLGDDYEEMSLKEIEALFEKANMTDFMFYRFEEIDSQSWLGVNDAGFSGKFGYLDTK